MRHGLARVAALVLIAVSVVLVGWRLDGGRWVTVQTPSMGTRAPVGSLLWVRPARIEELRTGDFVTVRPAGMPSSYSHQVAAVHADGTISTRGRITSTDPWRIDQDQLAGRVVAVWPGAGWLIRALPVLALGAVLIVSVVRRLRDGDSRVPVAVVGVAVVLAAAITVYRPFIRAEQLSFEPAAGGARATYVSTGLLPVRVVEPGGSSVRLEDGQVGSVLASSRNGHRFEVTVRPDVPPGWWIALVGLCFVPAAASAARGLWSRRQGTGLSIPYSELAGTN